MWDGTRIQAGAQWREEIAKALDYARIAVLVITTDFLASDFITKNELPRLLKAAEDDGARIIPLIVKPSRFDRNKSLSRFQAINDPAKPLTGLPEDEQEEILVALTNVIEDFLT